MSAIGAVNSVGGGFMSHAQRQARAGASNPTQRINAGIGGWTGGGSTTGPNHSVHNLLPPGIHDLLPGIVLPDGPHTLLPPEIQDLLPDITFPDMPWTTLPDVWFPEPPFGGFPDGGWDCLPPLEPPPFELPPFGLPPFDFLPFEPPQFELPPFDLLPLDPPSFVPRPIGEGPISFEPVEWAGGGDVYL